MFLTNKGIKMKETLMAIIIAALAIYGASKLLDSFSKAPEIIEKSSNNFNKFLHLSQDIPKCMDEFKASSRYTGLTYDEQSKVDTNLYNDVNKAISFGMAACGTEQYRVGIELAFNSAKTIYLPPRLGAVDTILGEFIDDHEKLCVKAVNLINSFCPVKARMIEFE